MGEEAEVGQGLVPHDAEERPDEQHLQWKSPNCTVLSSIIYTVHYIQYLQHDRPASKTQGDFLNLYFTKMSNYKNSI